MANKFHSLIIKEVAKKTGKTQAVVKEIVEEYLCIISDTLNENTNVTIRDFGTFKLSQRKERQFINPLTREKITVPAKEVVTFKPASKIRQYTQIYKK